MSEREELCEKEGGALIRDNCPNGIQVKKGGSFEGRERERERERGGRAEVWGTGLGTSGS